MPRVPPPEQLKLEAGVHDSTQRPRSRRNGSSPLPKSNLRLAVSPDEAAAALGVSRDYFDEHVISELRIVRRGRRILVSLAELERWLDRSAARVARPS
jgi:excisionase family DNA binding protein